VDVSESVGVGVGGGPFPDDFILEVILPKKLVEQDLDVVAGVPVAVVIEAAGWFEDAVKGNPPRNFCH
jgi:hypothetical protein